jgi:Mor family transcriptional regulator
MFCLLVAIDHYLFYDGHTNNDTENRQYTLGSKWIYRVITNLNTHHRVMSKKQYILDVI